MASASIQVERSLSSSRRVRLSVVIPALNEEDCIAEIIGRIHETQARLVGAGVEETEIVVVDDGSDDRTGAIASAMAGVRVIRHETRRGYGAALKTGFGAASGDLLAFIDADGTYPPEHLPQLCFAAMDQDADVVVGSRRSGAESHMPAVRRLGNFIWSNLVSLIGDRPCVDPASGMRVLRRSALTQLYPLPDGLNFTPVMSTRSVHEKLNVIELPIPYSERVGRSKLSVVRDGLRFLSTILWTALEYNPAKIFGLTGTVLASAAVLLGAGVVAARWSGVTQLGPWGIFAIFAILVLAVTGTSLYTLGITSNALMATFHREPMRGGMFRKSGLERTLESRFRGVGLTCMVAGLVLAAVAITVGFGQWSPERLWFWLLGSGLFLLVGVQLIASWIVARTFEQLAAREEARRV
jgi:glycosyltransferase involved in cell wall biosynthesis